MGPTSEGAGEPYGGLTRTRHPERASPLGLVRALHRARLPSGAFAPVILGAQKWLDGTMRRPISCAVVSARAGAWWVDAHPGTRPRWLASAGWTLRRLQYRADPSTKPAVSPVSRPTAVSYVVILEASDCVRPDVGRLDRITGPEPGV